MADNKAGKEILMIFTDPHIVYSPSTLNIFHKLKEDFKVQLVSARQSTYYTDNQLVDENIKYIDFVSGESIFNTLEVLRYKVADKFVKPSAEKLAQRSLSSYKTKALIEFLKDTGKEIIAVDFMALWCVQQVGKKGHVLSLELHQNDVYFNAIKFDTIKSVIIQSAERLNYLFPDKKPKHFIVQNSPKYIDFKPPYIKRKKTDLVFCGTAVSGFGIISCLDFIKDYKEYTLTLKGAFPKDTEEVIGKFYADLLAEKRLIIDTAYLTETELAHYVAKFRIGFAFYDFYRFAHLRTFNYYTAPSGKVFQYLNSGVPVIANQLPGFQFIKDGDSGKLIDHLSTTQIKAAIDAIEADYERYAKNAKKASLAFDFNQMIRPFAEHIKAELGS